MVSYLDESLGMMPQEEAEKYLNLLKKSDGVRRVLLGLSVRVPVGDVVGVVGEEDKVVDIPHGETMFRTLKIM